MDDELSLAIPRILAFRKKLDGARAMTYCGFDGADVCRRHGSYSLEGYAGYDCISIAWRRRMA